MGRLSPGAPILAGVAHLLLVHVAAAVTVWRSPGRDAVRPDLEGPVRYLVSPLAIWDGGWYWRIVLDGYGESRATAAFWPLYPWLVRALSSVTGWGPETSGVVLSTLAFMAALLVLYRLVALSYGDAAAVRTVWLVALCPVAFFFSAFYTESVFLLLSAGAVLLARRGQWTGAALVALLATLTRSAGLLVLLPLGVALLEQARANHRWPWRPGLQLAAAGAGPLVFAVHLERLWGDPLLMVDAQAGWHRAFSPPWETLWSGFRWVGMTYVAGRHACFEGVRERAWPPCRDALGLRIDVLSDDLALASALVALALLPVVVRRLVAGDAIYAVAAFAFFLSSSPSDNPLMSLPRYLLVTYPFFVALALLLRPRALFLGVLGVSAAGLCWLLSIFARAYFVA